MNLQLISICIHHVSLHTPIPPAPYGANKRLPPPHTTYVAFLFFNFILRWVVNIGIHILTVILPIKWTWKGQVKVCWPPFTARRRKLRSSVYILDAAIFLFDFMIYEYELASLFWAHKWPERALLMEIVGLHPNTEVKNSLRTNLPRCAILSCSHLHLQHTPAAHTHTCKQLGSIFCGTYTACHPPSFPINVHFLRTGKARRIKLPKQHTETRKGNMCSW